MNRRELLYMGVDEHSFRQQHISLILWKEPLLNVESISYSSLKRE
jgi:hypothetical protein